MFVHVRGWEVGCFACKRLLFYRPKNPIGPRLCFFVLPPLRDLLIDRKGLWISRNCRWLEPGDQSNGVLVVALGRLMTKGTWGPNRSLHFRAVHVCQQQLLRSICLGPQSEHGELHFIVRPLQAPTADHWELNYFGGGATIEPLTIDFWTKNLNRLLFPQQIILGVGVPIDHPMKSIA